ncbi:DUF3566 domain-containing protein [Streptomyces sp. V4-01]|uniref:DUF3566 domain-containing protein n=1 Tax=Actinacidiphila polyblastidii TaxID=3110430 RepID=A0ABU7P5W2_9ACTN|nr:DUF3566 domain-containing protein [Streptomyces sp. V4-01]
MSGATGAAGGTGRTGGSHGSAPSSGPQEGGYTVTDTRQPPQPHQPPSAYAPPPPGGAPGGAPAGAGGPQSANPAAAGVRRPRPAARSVPRTRKARLRVSKADPWSVMKVSFLLSIALGICTIIAVAVLWMVLDTIGVFSTVGSTISDATNSENGKGGFDLVSFLSLSRVMMFTTVIAVIDVVLATALATLGAFIYNLSAGFVGGVELTLAEDE